MENQAYLKRKKEYNIIIKNQYLILYRFINEKAHLINISTIGTPHAFCSYQLSDGALVNVDIVDTAGQEKFRSIGKQFYKKADGCLLVYDITRRATFEAIQNFFLKEIKDNCKLEIKIILLGNKTDLEEQRQVSIDEGANFASNNEFMFMETSCLLNRNVADSFETLIELIYRDVLEKNRENTQENQVTIGKPSIEKKSKCC